jgi:hypothetical protein
MPYTTTALNAIQNYLNRDVAMTPPANWYFSLHLMNELTAAAAIADTTITVDYAVTNGVGIIIAPETASAETRTVTGVTGAGPYLLTLNTPLAITHAAAVEVLCDPGPNGENPREPSGGGFARVSKVRNTTDFAASASGVTTNATAILFPTITTGIGTATHLLKWSASTAGTLWEWSRLSRKIVLDAAANPLQFPAGNAQSTFAQR